MANNYSFSVMPTVSISRSRFERKSQHKTSFNLGDIIPIYCDEVLPGDTRSLDMASLVRMSTPIAPIMDNIYLDFFAFFVPNRIVWDHWKEFQGENNVSAGIPSNTYSIPYVIAGSNTGLDIETGSYWDYFGLPVGFKQSLALPNAKVSALPFRGLMKIYNRWFRNQNVIAPLAVNTGDTGQIITGETAQLGGPVSIISASKILKASKVPDYFVTALPYAQKGTAVTIPLGTTAPVMGTGSMHLMGSYGILFGTTATNKVPAGSALDISANQDGVLAYGSGSGSAGSTTVNASNLVADLSNATAATINQLRYAFQLQKLLEKDALYGTRYWEILAAHFGVTAPDASLQDPEYLGGKRMRINIDQVLSTAGYDPSDQTLVGQPGANSVSGFKGSIFTKSFVEHGYLFILAVARHDQTYMQGINRMWTRRTRYDFYMPVFANLGAQDIKLKELYFSGVPLNDDSVFGYQEAWAEYRFKPSIATGKLRPLSGNLDFWTLTNNFGSAPTLGQTFIEQDRDNIARALVTGVNGPDFIADFYFRDVAVRPMPVYSIPGLIDHH